MSTAADGTRQRIRGLGYVAIAGLIWGSIPLVLRSADGASVVKVFYRVLFAAVVIGGWMLLSGRWRELTRLGRRKVTQVGVQGLILTLNWVLFLSALDRTTVATAELLGYTGPVYVAALAPLVSGERFDRRIIAPVLLALAGIAIILIPEGIDVSSGRSFTGAVLAFCSALTYAVLLLRSKKIISGISSSSLMVLEYGIASAVLLPFVVAAYARGDGPTGMTSYAALAILGVVQTALAGFIFLRGLRRVRADHAAVLTYMEPVAAVFFASLFLGEPLTMWTVVGGACVVAGGTWVARLEATGGHETVPFEVAGTEETPPPGGEYSGESTIRREDTP